MTLTDNPRMLSGESSAEFCRRMGYGVGTRLTGDEGFGPSVVILTAIGEETILARELWVAGDPYDGRESRWTLECRDWIEVAGAPAYYGA